MKTTLRIISKGGSVYITIPNPANIVPTKGSYVVFQKESICVDYTEMDFDNNELFIVCIK